MALIDGVERSLKQFKSGRLSVFVSAFFVPLKDSLCLLRGWQNQRSKVQKPPTKLF